VCIDNGGYPASLELRKIYRLLPDAEARRRGLVRVVDESGEDYLYASRCFCALKPPKAVRALLIATTAVNA
jgi:hypothetical protein